MVLEESGTLTSPRWLIAAAAGHIALVITLLEMAAENWPAPVNDPELLELIEGLRQFRAKIGA